MKPKYHFKAFGTMDFIFLHWSLYALFWVTAALIPMSFFWTVIFDEISPKTQLWIGAYIIMVFTFNILLASFVGFKYTHTQRGGVKNYESQRYRVLGIMIPIGAAVVYCTGFLFTIPFTEAPNYVFTLKPSKQLEMELNHMMGAGIIEYTPFDYSLDKQKVIYVADRDNASELWMIGSFSRRPEKYVELEADDFSYLLAIKKMEPFELVMLDGGCYFQARVEEMESRTINHPRFKTPVILEMTNDGKMRVDTKGAFFVSGRGCENALSYGKSDSDASKALALQAYIKYPNIYDGVIDYDTVRRRTYDFTLEHFDSRISGF